MTGAYKLLGCAVARITAERDAAGDVILEIYLPNDYVEGRPQEKQVHRLVVHGPPIVDLIEAISHSESLSPRGIGSDSGTCFVCGDGPRLMSNFAGFVASREAGQRVVDMFGGKGAWLDFRPHEPQWIQVKVTACAKHASLLESLSRHVRDQGNTIAKYLVERWRDKYSVKMAEEEYAKQMATPPAAAARADV